MKTLEERFWSKVFFNQNGCWEWTGAQNGRGYGQIWNGEKTMQAHWFLLPEKPQKGFEACHKCDNRKCVNPSHIFIGTRSDNMQDCVKKGRNKASVKRAKTLWMFRKKWSLGEENKTSKLTSEQAMICKCAPKVFGMKSFLAKTFGVSNSVITRIMNGKSWPHLGNPTEADFQRCEAFLRLKGQWE